MAVLDWLQQMLGGGGDPDQQRWAETQAQQPAVLLRKYGIMGPVAGGGLAGLGGVGPDT